MNWDPILLGSLSADADVPLRIDALFAHQRAHWTLLREGERAVSQVRTKTLTLDGAQVIVQSNPGRKRSVHAKTDPHSISNRACFLCPENLPAEERGMAFDELVILPNPYPVLPKHCTVTDRTHRPQRLEGRLGTMLDLATAIGPDLLVFYNGPRCGASAPDHFHFQVCDTSGIPIVGELCGIEEILPIFGHASFGRRMLVFADAQASPLAENISRALDLLSQRDVAGEEPMVNLLVNYTDGRYLAVLIPRTAHRPACYFADGPDRLAVSPAALEMAGVLVVADPDHFDRVDVATARSLYDEVCLEESRFNQLVEAMP